MQHSAIFDEALLEKKIEKIHFLALAMNENERNTPFNTYSKHVFAPLHDYLEESFISGIVKKGADFAAKFTKGAKDIAAKISGVVKEFSYNKIFTTVTKMMHKIKVKMLKQLMNLLEPLREVIIKFNFCNEDNKFQVKETFNKLVSLAKDVGKDIGAPELLSVPVVDAIAKNIKMGEVEGIVGESETAEKALGHASLDKDDVKYIEYFQKMMFKLGIKNAKLNGFFAEVTKKIVQGSAIIGIFAIIGALFPSIGIVSGITAAAGAVVAAAPVLVMIIGAILFGIGLFMFATWLLKPYPTIENCRIFLASIFRGANIFDYPESSTSDMQKSAVPPKKAKPLKNPFDFELLHDLEEEGVEKEIPGNGEDYSVIVKTYDDLDTDLLENDDEVEKNKRIAKIFVRNCFTKKGRDRIQDILSEIEDDEEDNSYTEAVGDFVSLIDDIYRTDAISEEDEDGKKKYPYALNYEKIREFLRSKENSVADRMTKVIDVTDNFIDRIDKKETKTDEKK